MGVGVVEGAGTNQGRTLGVGDAAIALAATALAFLILVLSAIAGQESSPELEGTLVAAFVTKTEIVLCSDGRVVNSSDGSVVRDDWSKVHQLNDRIGLLTAGRDLPGFTQRARVKLSRQTSTSMADTVNTIRVALQEEWASLANGHTPTQGRAFVFVAGFDETGAPRLFHFDSQSSPAFKVNEMPLFTVSRDLEVGAIATGMDQQDPAATIVKYLDGLQKGQPALGLHRLLLGAFNATKAELGSRNSRIGGLTFAATIDLTNGFRAITAW
jgi:hypothetical protein